jgi:hypothetical protein
MRIQTVDKNYLLVRCISPQIIMQGRGAGSRQHLKTKVQRLGILLSSILRPKLRKLYFINRYRADPTGSLDKKTALVEFKK